jgi:hypothetical protein
VGQCIQPAALVGQQARHPAKRPVRPGRQPRPRDPHRQRQPTTGSRDRGGRRRFGRHPPGSGDPGQQRLRLVSVQHVQMHQPGTLQPRQPRPAGNQHRTAGAAGQQRADLGLAGGVVQDHQHPPACQATAVQRRAFLYPGGDRAAVHAHGAQEPTKDLRRLQRRHARGAGAGATKAGIKLPVREVGSQLVGDMDRQRALAHPRLAGYRTDRHRGPVDLVSRTVWPARAPLAELDHQLGAAHEVGNVWRQLLRGSGLGRARHRSRCGLPSLRRPTMRGRLEPLAFPPHQAKPIGQQPHRRITGAAGRSLQVPDRARAQPRPLPQPLLRQQPTLSVGTQQPTKVHVASRGEVVRSFGHARPPHPIRPFLGRSCHSLVTPGAVQHLAAITEIPKTVVRSNRLTHASRWAPHWESPVNCRETSWCVGGRAATIRGL